jgi:hypothetical protein
MNVLRGPADADHFRVQVGRYHERWYVDPLQGDAIAEATDAAWPSVSTIKKASGADWSFVSLRRAAEGIAANPDRIKGLPVGELYDAVSSMNKRGLDAAAQRGTNVHAACDALLRGDRAVILPGMPGVEYLPAVEAFFDTYQPELVASEIVVVHRSLNGVGYGGTGDGIVRIGGKLYKLDWKTRGADSNHGAYPEEAAQIAGYANAEYMIVMGDDGHPHRAPMPAFDGGLIVSIKPDGFRVYPVDLDKAHRHWCSLHAWWVARRDEREPIGRPWAPKAAKATPVVERFDRSMVVERVRALVTAGHGERLALRWPAGVPGLAETDGHSEDQLEQILGVVRAVEDDTSAQFHPADMVPATTVLAIDAVREVVASIPPPPPAEGATLATGDVDTIASELATLTDLQRAAIGAIAAEAHADGRSISLVQRPSIRRFGIARALIALARSCDLDDDATRGLLALVMDDAAAEWPTLPLGAVIGALTIDEAARLAELAPLIGTSALELTIHEDGRFEFIPNQEQETRS